MKMKLITEKLFKTDNDTDYIFDIAYKQLFKDIEEGKQPYVHDLYAERDVELAKIDSSDLKEYDCIKAHLVNPVKIVCGIFRTGNYYQPKNNIIQISLHAEALLYKYKPSIFDLTTDQSKTIVNEITENRIKSSISHELSHWIDDSINNNFLSNILKRAEEFGIHDIKLLGKKDVNLTYFEIQAQIHAIASLKRTYKGDWDSLTLDDLFKLYTALNSIRTKVESKYGKDVLNIWKKHLIKRMSREGLVGKNMRNFQSY